MAKKDPTEKLSKRNYFSCLQNKSLKHSLNWFSNKLIFKEKQKRWNESPILKNFYQLVAKYEPTTRKKLINPVIFFTEGNFTPLETFDNVYRHSWLLKMGKGVTGIYWADVRDAVKHSTMHRIVAYKRVNLAQNNSNINVEKPCDKLSEIFDR